MTRSALIHVALLGALLVAAFFTWTREPDSTSDDIALISARGGLDRVDYHEPDRKVTIERRKDEHGEYQWVTVETMVAPPAPPAPPPAPAKPADAAKKPDEPKKPDEAIKPDEAKKPDEPKKPVEAKKPVEVKKPLPKVKKVQTFLGSQSAEELMKSLAKFSALRALGPAEGKKLEGFGLHKKDRGMTLAWRGSNKALVIGDNTYGNMDRYVKDGGDGRVYVVAPRYIGDFPYAEFRLKDSAISRTERVKMERVELAAGGKKKVLLQRHNNTPQKAFFADESAPDKAQQLYANWMDKLNRLSVVEYITPGSEPKGLTEALVVTYRAKGKVLDLVKLYKAPVPVLPVIDGKKAAPAPVPVDAYARSLHSRVLVKINGTLLDELLRDVDSILK